MLSEKPWRIGPFLMLLGLMVICLLFGGVAAEILRRVLGEKAMEKEMVSLILSIACLHGAGLVAIILFVREHKVSWAEAFGFKNGVGWAVTLGFCVAILALPACLALQGLMAEFFKRVFGFTMDEQEAIQALRIADVWWKQAVLGFFAIVLAPFVEEVFFRGILYPMIKQNTFQSPRLSEASRRRGAGAFALLSSALLFALIHGNIVVIVPLTLLALALALLYEWTNNLLTCIVVHSLFNTANFVMLFAIKNGWKLPGQP